MSDDDTKKKKSRPLDKGRVYNEAPKTFSVEPFMVFGDDNVEFRGFVGFGRVIRFQRYPIYDILTIQCGIGSPSKTIILATKDTRAIGETLVKHDHIIAYGGTFRRKRGNIFVASAIMRFPTATVLQARDFEVSMKLNKTRQQYERNDEIDYEEVLSDDPLAIFLKQSGRNSNLDYRGNDDDEK